MFNSTNCLIYFECEFYTFIRPNQDQFRKMQLYRPNTNINTEKKLSTQHQHREKIKLLDYIGIEGTRFCSEISLTLEPS
jgi:hypothetical protein